MTRPNDALRLVPVEPTREMIEAGASREWSATYNTPEWKAADRALKADYRKQAKLTFKAMLSAASASPLPEGGGPTCQVCGDKIEAWTCQGCGAQFHENDAGSLVLGIPAAPTGAK